MAAAPRSILFSPIWPWLLVSGVTHALLVLLFGLWGVFGANLGAGRGIETGQGFGGDSVELEIAGPLDRTPTGSTAGALGTAPPAPAAPPEPEVVEPAAEPEGTLPVARVRERPTPQASNVDDGPGESEAPAAAGRSAIAENGDPEETNTTQSSGDQAAAGTGSDESTAGVSAGDARGLILGSVGAGGDALAAQRALLPNSGRCTDPVVGTWRAQKYRASDRTWVRFILRVRREGDELRGTIDSRIWRGQASNPIPGECTAFGYDHTWRMNARGRLAGDRLTFGSRQVRLVRQDCPMADTRYAPDNFSGTLHVEREIFDAINNDGAFDVDEPYTFRRTSCE